MFVDEDNGDVDNIPSDGEGLDGNDETSDESDADSDVSKTEWSIQDNEPFHLLHRFSCIISST